MRIKHAPMGTEEICPFNDSGGTCGRWSWYKISMIHYMTLVFTTVVTWSTALQLTLVHAGICSFLRVAHAPYCDTFGKIQG